MYWLQVREAGNNSASRRGFLRLSRVLPTSRVFTSGYVNTETILHFFNLYVYFDSEMLSTYFWSFIFFTS